MSMSLFSEDTIPAVEKDVFNGYNHQLQCDLMKLYQYYPSKANESIVETMLVRALAAAPNPDFSNLCTLLTPKLAKNPLVPKLIKLDNFLQRGKYVKFWATLSEPDFADISSKLDESLRSSIRGYIMLALHRLFKTISTSELSQFLGLSVEEVKAFIVGKEAIASIGEDGESVLFVAIPENSARQAFSSGYGLGVKFRDAYTCLSNLNALM